MQDPPSVGRQPYQSSTRRSPPMFSSKSPFEDENWKWPSTTTKGELHTSPPGEIILFQQENSIAMRKNMPLHRKSKTAVLAQNLPSKICPRYSQNYALQAFQLLKLQGLWRESTFFTPPKMELFVTKSISFPDSLPSPCFPKMLEHNGPSFKDWLGGSTPGPFCTLLAALKTLSQDPLGRRTEKGIE